MQIQYLLDNLGKTTAVVIPIGDWEVMTHKYSDLKQLSILSDKKKKPSEFAGILTQEDAQKMQHYLKETRNQWGRNTY